jgi:hypothetical protein
VGAVDFSLHCLDEVIKNRGDVVGVLTLAKEDSGFHASGSVRHQGIGPFPGSHHKRGIRRSVRDVETD